jgi:N-acetylneuraminic acid mutarotase
LELPALESYRENQVNEFVRDALDSLPEIYREALMLRYFGGMNSSEIAKALGTSPTAVRKRLSRAHARMRKEMVAMMGTAFEGQKLQASFTFRVVDAIKRIKIHTMPRMAGLPWGLSLATGIIISVLSLNSHLTIVDPLITSAGSPLPVKTKVLKTGEIPVDIIKTDEMSVISGNQGDGDVSNPKFPDLQNAFALAPRGEMGKWTEKASMPTARWGLSTSAFNRRIYAFGGGPNAKVAISTVEEYDPAIDTWTKKSDMPIPTGRLSTGLVNGRIYIIGGGFAGKAISNVYEYDPATDTWSEKADMPTARGALSASVVNGKIYAIGGLSGWDDAFPTVEEYDPATDRWTKKTDMPTARSGLSTSAFNGKIYAIGGAVPPYAPNQINVLSTVEEYDPVTDSWTRKADMPTARGSLSTIVISEKILAIGGANKSGQSLSVVEEYDPATDTWTGKGNMITARADLSASVVNGKIYAIGGSTIIEGSGLSTVEEYTPEGWQYISLQDKLPTQWGEIKSH